MPSDASPAEQPAIDVGLLSPVTAGHDEQVSDAAFLDALVTAEVALVRAYATLIPRRQSVADEVSEALGWRGMGRLCRGHGIDARALAAASVAGGNPVIPLVSALKERVGRFSQHAIHRGATSQDILDSALVLLARDAGAAIGASLGEVEEALAVFAAAHRDEVAAARTLTQHAVPTTVGLRAATWLRGVRRARQHLDEAATALPAQLGGAAGTLAAFDEILVADLGSGGHDLAGRLPAAFAAELDLAAPEAPWHTTRWPITELADALVQAIDAVGKIATDVATLSRTEIGELAEGVGGGSSAMPQKQNPVASVLIRSAALRAPQLGATLHLASALAGDERPDGAWHAEWPTLRELLRLALGATANAVRLVEGLRVDLDAVARNLALTNGLIVSERLSIELTPVIGKDAVASLVAAAGRGEDLAALLQNELQRASDREGRSQFPVGGVAALLDPTRYTGLAQALIDGALEHDEGDPS